MVCGFVLGGGCIGTRPGGCAVARRGRGVRWTCVGVQGGGEEQKARVWVDESGVENVQRLDDADVWIGSDLARWHSYHRSERVRLWFEDFAFGWVAEEEKEDDGTGIERDKDEEFEKEVQLFAAATDYELIDREGEITPRGFMLFAATMLPFVLLAFVFSGMLAESLVNIGAFGDFTTM